MRRLAEKLLLLIFLLLLLISVIFPFGKQQTTFGHLQQMANNFTANNFWSFIFAANNFWSFIFAIAFVYIFTYLEDLSP